MEGWLDKNKDPLNDSVVELLKKSSDPFIALIWADYVSSAEGTQRKGKGSQFITVGQRHKVCVRACGVCVCMCACVVRVHRTVLIFVKRKIVELVVQSVNLMKLSLASPPLTSHDRSP